MKISTYLSTALLGLATVLALAACQLPFSSGSPRAHEPSKVIPQPAAAQLIFRSTLGRAILGTTDTYMTVRLTSLTDGSVHYASASRVGFDYPVAVEGLTAGTWQARVRLYASSSSPDLLFYANVSTTVEPSQVGPKVIPVRLLEPGTLVVNNQTVTLAAPISYLEVDRNATVLASSRTGTVNKSATTGEEFILHATAVAFVSDEEVNPSYDADTNNDALSDEYFQPGLDGNTTDDPWYGDDEAFDAAFDSNNSPDFFAIDALDQNVVWTSDDPDVASVDNDGKVHAYQPGTATLRVSNFQGSPTVTIVLHVDDPIVGEWENLVTYENDDYVVNHLFVTRNDSGDLEVRLLSYESHLGDLGASNAQTLEVGRIGPDEIEGRYAGELTSHWDFEAGQFQTQNSETASVVLWNEDADLLKLDDNDSNRTLSFTRIGNYSPVTALALTTPVTSLDLGDNASADAVLSGTPSVDALAWWTEDPSIVTVNSRTGYLTTHSTGSTTIHVASLDNPEVEDSFVIAVYSYKAALNETGGRRFTLSNPTSDSLYLSIDTTGLPNQNYDIWYSTNGGAWALWSDLVDTNPGFHGPYSVDGLAPSSAVSFRFVTKGNTGTGGYVQDSAPSSVITGYTLDSDGNPAVFSGPNDVPGPDGNWFTLDVNLDGSEILEGLNYFGESYYSAFYDNAGTSRLSTVQFIGVGEDVWWFFSHPGPSSDPKVVFTKIDRFGSPSETDMVSGQSKVRSTTAHNNSPGPNTYYLTLATEQGSTTLWWDSTNKQLQTTDPDN